MAISWRSNVTMDFSSLEIKSLLAQIKDHGTQLYHLVQQVHSIFCTV